MVWHRRMRHQSSQHLPFVSDISSCFDFKNNFVCDTCYRARQTRSPFCLSKSNAVDYFKLIHCDLWGLYPKPSSCGAYCFFTLVDDYSQGASVYLMRKRSEAIKLLMDFCKLIKT